MLLLVWLPSPSVQAKEGVGNQSARSGPSVPAWGSHLFWSRSTSGHASAGPGSVTRPSERPLLPPCLLNPVLATATWMDLHVTAPPPCTWPQPRACTRLLLCSPCPLRLQRLSLLISTCSQRDQLECQVSHQRPRAKTGLCPPSSHSTAALPWPRLSFPRLRVFPGASWHGAPPG